MKEFEPAGRHGRIAALEFPKGRSRINRYYRLSESFPPYSLAAQETSSSATPHRESILRRQPYRPGPASPIGFLQEFWADFRMVIIGEK